jgi:hypothetical protein
VDENLPMQNVFSDEHFFHEFAAANYFTLLPLSCCAGQRAAMYRCKGQEITKVIFFKTALPKKQTKFSALASNLGQKKTKKNIIIIK